MKAHTALRPKAWVIHPAVDFGLFIATPLLLAFGFQRFLTAGLLPFFKLAILGISSTGHHLPGIIRAYTDKVIFQRFRWRLVLVPSLFILLAGFCAFYQLGYILFAVITWSIWHGAMQIMGFLRIYDAKSGFNSQLTARLDFWICMTWFVQIMFWAPSRVGAIFSAFYLAGGPLLPAGPVHAMEVLWLWLTVAVTVAYIANTFYQGFSQGYWHFPKLATLIVSLCFWAWCMLGIGNIIIGLILWEIFHDLQYNVFVWNYNHHRVVKGLSQSPLERFLFRSDWKTVLLYSACILLYGCLGVYSRDVIAVYQNQDVFATWISRFANVFAASALIHFYTDGFIWKVRDQKVRQDLGLTGDSQGFIHRSNALHLAMVLVFFGAGIWMSFTEFHWQRTTGGRGKPDNLAELVPRSAYAHFMKASRLRTEGKSDSAKSHYRRAIDLDANYGFAHAFIGEIETAEKHWAEAIRHYELAGISDPENVPVLENLAALYLQTNAFEKALAAYLDLQQRNPSNPDYAYQTGFTLLNLHLGKSAKPHLLRSLALDSAQPLALNYLGMIEQVNGNRDSAELLYNKAIQLDSTYAEAQKNLANLKSSEVR